MLGKQPETASVFVDDSLSQKSLILIKRRVAKGRWGNYREKRTRFDGEDFWYKTVVDVELRKELVSLLSESGRDVNSTSFSKYELIINTGRKHQYSLAVYLARDETEDDDIDSVTHLLRERINEKIRLN